MPRHSLIAVLVLVAASPAAAGWLVTHDGDVLETAGDWRLDGALVVFTTEDGQLSSIRARDVDLEASRARSAEPSPEPMPAPDTRPAGRETRAVLVLTDEDVSHVLPAREPEPGEADLGSEPSAGAPETARRGSLVEVVRWNDRVDVEANSLQVSGSIANRGPGVATNTRVEVRLLDSSGELLETRRASLHEPVMQPGAVVPFTATFPGSPGFATIEFDVSNRGFRLRPAADPASSQPIDP